ncbi:MAG: hypothetical protein EAZ15_02730 [Sphingobacteriales bacterium]|nr:MAG: hypothetical protein EAZ15_02730 [Sphingobacteriales bacterium]
MKFLFSFLLLLTYILVPAQTKLLKKLFPNDTTRHNSFLPVPALGYSQEAGFQVGLAGIFSFYNEIKNPVNKASTVFTNFIYSTKGQNRITLKSDIWTKGNAFHIIGDVRIARSLFDFYGLGNQTNFANKDKILQKQLRFGLEVEKEFFKNLYLGLGAEFDNQKFEDVEQGGIFSLNAPIDRNGGKAVFLKFTQFYDTRNNSIYPDRGVFVRSRVGYAPDFFGDNNFKGNHIDVDFRTYKKLSNKLILGFNVNLEKLNYANNVEAFYFQPQIGGDQMMRGYYLGRYRAPNLVATQAELRYRIIPRFGIVGFAGTGTVFNNKQFDAKYLKPNYGIGTRFFFDLEKALSLRIDYGFGEKPLGEKRISGFYVALGESF